jgi:hypothetical protein
MDRVPGNLHLEVSFKVKPAGGLLANTVVTVCQTTEEMA